MKVPRFPPTGGQGFPHPLPGEPDDRCIAWGEDEDLAKDREICPGVGYSMELMAGVCASVLPVPEPMVTVEYSFPELATKI